MPDDTTGQARIEGIIKLETSDTIPKELNLTAYAFDKLGKLAGSGKVDEKGNFQLTIGQAEPKDLDIYIAPESDPQTVRQSHTYTKSVAAADFKKEGKVQVLRTELAISKDIWWPWRPIRICVSGHVRKVHPFWPYLKTCPVPYVKVEIFDVDREWCYWPYFRKRWPELVDQPVIPIPELIKPDPFPIGPFPGPGPDPGPLAGIANPALRNLNPFAGVALNPQPLPPREVIDKALAEVSLNPQPEPPAPKLTASSVAAVESRVGEIARVPETVANHLENLTLTSVLPPWIYFPRCFYSKALVCTTSTDCEGFFKCCFNWYPFHVRRGRLRFDAKPDIIVRITQMVNGVPHVVYMDPYTSTRWNVTNAYIDLYLNNPEVRCGSPKCPGPPPKGPVAFFTLIGDDDVYKISQTNGLYPAAGATGVEPGLTNLPYGYSLRVSAAFGDTLSNGAPKRYYRLSYAKQTTPGVTPPDAAFQPITMPAAGLADRRINKATLIPEDGYALGPQTVGTQPGLYEIRDQQHYFWDHPQELGQWLTWVDEPDTGTYVLRLEVFDNAGNKMNSPAVDYKNNTVLPPTPLPSMGNACDLVITLDNKNVNVDIGLPGVGPCGVIQWSPTLSINITSNVQQGHNRIHAWTLTYVKGTLGPSGTLDSGPPSTLVDPVSKVVTVTTADPMLAGLTTTCAYALYLTAVAHITNGESWTDFSLHEHHIFPYTNYQIKAIAIEKCGE
jgi:hypothetical protein